MINCIFLRLGIKKIRIDVLGINTQRISKHFIDL